MIYTKLVPEIQIETTLEDYQPMIERLSLALIGEFPTGIDCAGFVLDEILKVSCPKEQLCLMTWYLNCWCRVEYTSISPKLISMPYKIPFQGDEVEVINKIKIDFERFMVALDTRGDLTLPLLAAGLLDWLECYRVLSHKAVGLALFCGALKFIISLGCLMEITQGAISSGIGLFTPADKKIYYQ
jgi:hypothetical protein